MKAAEMSSIEEPQVREAVPRARPSGDEGPDVGDLAVEAYARDHEGLTSENERDALDYLLGAKPAREYDVKVQVDTDEGLRPLTIVIRAMDGRKIDDIEQRHVSETTGRLDQLSADCELAGEACVAMISASGRTVSPASEEWRTMNVRRSDTGEVAPFTHASAAEAIEARFRTQLGLVSGVAREIRRVSGYDAARVGQAQRRLVEASGN